MSVGVILCSGAVILMLIGCPVAYAMTGASIFTLLSNGTPLLILPQRFFSQINSFSLMAILYFVVAGELMLQGGISRRLVNLSKLCFGWLRGSLSMICFVTCAFFGAISGSGLATSAAIGGIMYPEMIKNNDYSPEYSAGILAVGGTLGLMIPPSIPLILYGTTTGASIGDLFIAIIVPGLIMMVLFLVTSQIIILKNGYAPIREKSGDGQKLDPTRVLLEGIPALLSPVIILGTIYTGICTPTESAIIACVYSIFVGFFIYRELNRATFFKAILESAQTSAIIMFLIAAASCFGWVMTSINLTSRITDWLLAFASTKIVFLLLANFLYLAAGMLLETGTIVLLAVPLLFPVSQAFGIDPVHFGVITVINLAIGLFTPPFGTGVFLMAGKSNLSVSAVFYRIIPFIFVSIIGILLITYCPVLSTFLLK